MISVFMDCGSDDHRLARSLAPLVSGAVDGVVREVVLIDRGMGEACRSLADHAGCEVDVPVRLAARIEAAKGDFVMLLQPGGQLSDGWIGAALAHMQAVAMDRARTPAAGFAWAPGDRPGLLRRLMRRAAVLERGVLVPKAVALGRVRGGSSLEDIAKGLAVTRLDATIRRAAG